MCPSRATLRPSTAEPRLSPLPTTAPGGWTCTLKVASRPTIPTTPPGTRSGTGAPRRARRSPSAPSPTSRRTSGRAVDGWHQPPSPSRPGGRNGLQPGIRRERLLVRGGELSGRRWGFSRGRGQQAPARNVQCSGALRRRSYCSLLRGEPWGGDRFPDDHGFARCFWLLQWLVQQALRPRGHPWLWYNLRERGGVGRRERARQADLDVRLNLGHGGFWKSWDAAWIGAVDICEARQHVRSDTVAVAGSTCQEAQETSRHSLRGTSSSTRS